jgi:hypothetical protein
MDEYRSERIFDLQVVVCYLQVIQYCNAKYLSLQSLGVGPVPGIFTWERLLFRLSATPGKGVLQTALHNSTSCADTCS